MKIVYLVDGSTWIFITCDSPRKWDFADGWNPETRELTSYGVKRQVLRTEVPGDGKIQLIDLDVVPDPDSEGKYLVKVRLIVPKKKNRKKDDSLRKLEIILLEAKP